MINSTISCIIQVDISTRMAAREADSRMLLANTRRYGSQTASMLTILAELGSLTAKSVE